MNRNNIGGNILLILTSVLLCVLSCKKTGSYSTRNERKIVDKKWYVSQYFIDGVDETQYYRDSCNCFFEFRSNYWNRKAALCNCNWDHLGWELYVGDGFFDLSYDNKYFDFGFVFPKYSFDIPLAYHRAFTWDVLCVTKNIFNIRTKCNGKLYEMHLSTNKQ